MIIKCSDYLSNDAVKIRTEVFVTEQGFKVEFDEIDKKAKHIVMYDGETPVAVCRFYGINESGLYSVGRIAVTKQYRGRGLGAEILESAENEIKKLGGTAVELSAQVQAEKFYTKQGYTPIGDTYLDEYCPHIKMSKQLK